MSEINTINSNTPFSNSFTFVKTLDQTVQVTLSHELIGLLSGQLYQSPRKAIEELVVNSYDADATECRVFVPDNDLQPDSFIAIFDNGTGMTVEGLQRLWLIGHSDKRIDETLRRSQRKQIGKFGIGKLAANSIANVLTYVTKSYDADSKTTKILSATVDFSKFSSSLAGIEAIQIPVHNIENWYEFSKKEVVAQVLQAVGISPEKLADEYSSWTLAILESLKLYKIDKMGTGILRRVLSTAMPLGTSFNLFLNNDRVQSSKETYELAAQFELDELYNRRDSLKRKTGEDWRIEDKKLVSDSFPNGISGKIIVTKPTFAEQKSDDIIRSHGFFVYVRDRLINQDDALFGLKPVEYKVFNRFNAKIYANDLDALVKAPRETIEESELKEKFRVVLLEIFYEASARYTAFLKKLDTPNVKELQKNMFHLVLLIYLLLMH